MPLSDQLILETQTAFRELDALQGRLDRLSDVRLDVTLDTSGLDADLERSQRLAQNTAVAFGDIQDQTVLTAEEYRRAVRAMEEGVDASRAIAVATGRVEDEAASAEDAFRRVAQSLNLAENDAEELAREIGRTTREATELDADLRQVARSMGLSEQEASQFTAEMRRAAAEASDLDTRTGALVGNFRQLRGVIIGAVAAFGVQGLVRQFNEAVTSASDLEQSIGGVQAIFEEAAGEVLAFGESADQSVGLAESAFNQLAAQLGGQLQTFGFTAQEAGQEATRLIEIGADLAATFGGPVAQAVEAIGSLLRGEINPIERYGVSVNQAAISAEALRLGLADSTSEITIQTRAMAALSLLNQQTARAQGQFAREADTTAGQLERLRARAENLQAELGDALVPTFLEVVESANDLVPAIQDLVPVIELLIGQFEDVIAPAAALVDTLASVADIASAIDDAFGGLDDSDAPSFFDGVREATLNTLNPLRQLDDILDEVNFFFATGFSTDTFNDALRDIEANLAASVDPVTALEIAFDGLAQQGTVTAALLEQLAQAAQVTDEQLAGFLAEQLITRDDLGTADVEALRQALDEVIARLGIARGLGLNFDRGNRGADQLATINEELQQTLDLNEDLRRASFDFGREGLFTATADELQLLADAADDAGLSIFDFINQSDDLPPRLQLIVDQLSAAQIELFEFNDAAAGLATSIDVDFGDVVDEFDLLISKTNEAGEEVPATVEEIIDDLQEQANRLAELEAATAALEALGLDDLAANLRARGPEAAQAARDFLGDLDAAFEAEEIFDVGGIIPDDLAAQINTILGDADITPGLLDLAAQFSSDDVRQAILTAAVSSGQLFGDELNASLEALQLDPNQLRKLDLLPPTFEFESEDLGGTDLGEDFASDIGQGILNQGGVVTDSVQTSLLEAAAAGDSPAVLAEIDALAERLTLTIPVQFGPLPDLPVPTAPAQVVQGSGSSAGETIVNQTNNFFTEPQPTTDTQRITSSTAAITRNLIE